MGKIWGTDGKMVQKLGVSLIYLEIVWKIFEGWLQGGAPNG